MTPEEAETDSFEAEPIGGSQPVSAPAEVGEIVGGYRLETIIGQGGMGCVYLATHPKLGRRAAIKILYGQVAADAELVRRFFREAKVVNEIRHPSIVDIYDFVEMAEPKRIACIMEHLEGKTLAEILRSEKLDERKALGIADRLASALEAVHAHNVVHRDLKPDNIFVLGALDGEITERTIKILDFGIAKADHAAAERTATGLLLGTPAYMAPEQIAQAGVTGAADVYALGEILFEMIVGRRAFEGSNMEILRTKLSGQLPEFAVPPGPNAAKLKALLAGLLEPRPEVRISLGETRRVMGGLLGKAKVSEPPPRMSRIPTSDSTYSGVFGEPTGAKAQSIKIRLTPARVAAAGVLAVGLAWLVSRALRPDVQLVVEELPAAQLQPSSRIVRVATEPVGAAVVDEDGVELGKTPVEVSVVEPRRVWVKKVGYAERALVIDGAQPALEIALEKQHEVSAPPPAPAGKKGKGKKKEPEPKKAKAPEEAPKPKQDGPLKKHSLPTW